MTTKIVSFEAAIPESGSAIRVGGGASDCARLQLDGYFGNSLNQLLELRGKPLMVVVGPVADMMKLSEFIERGNRNGIGKASE